MEVVYKLAESNEEIKNWVEKHDGEPAILDDPEISEDVVGLRINWKGKKDESMLSGGRNTTRNISWEEFFLIMENHELAFMYSESEGISPTWIYKFVNKYSAEEE